MCHRLGDKTLGEPHHSRFHPRKSSLSMKLGLYVDISNGSILPNDEVSPVAVPDDRGTGVRRATVR